LGIRRHPRGLLTAILMTRRLEQDRFVWPRSQAVLELTTEQLHWLLDGIDVSIMCRHPIRHYHRVC
jgi:transposase